MVKGTRCQVCCPDLDPKDPWVEGENLFSQAVFLPPHKYHVWIDTHKKKI